MYKSDYKYSFKEKVFKFCHQVYSLIANRLVRVDDAFIINSYLPFKEEIKLELALRQFPQRWKRLKSKIYLDPDKLLRKKLTTKCEKITLAPPRET